MYSAIIGGSIALASAIGGTIASGQENTKAINLIPKAIDKNEAWYNQVRGEQGIDRLEAQAAIKKQQQTLEEQLRRTRKINTVAGGTDASLALQQQGANSSLAQTYTNIAANESRRKDAAEERYLQQDAALNQQLMQAHEQRAAQISQAAGQAVNAGLNLTGNSIYAKQSQA